MSWAGLDLSGASIVAVLGARDADVGHAVGAGLVPSVFLAAEGTIVSELCWAVLPALGANAVVSLVALFVAKSAPLLHAWRAGGRRLADAAAISLNPAAFLCRGKDSHEGSGRGSDFHCGFAEHCLIVKVSDFLIYYQKLVYLPIYRI